MDKTLVKVWIIDIAYMKDRPDRREKVCPSYLEKADRMRFEKGKLQELAAGYLLGECLGITSGDQLELNEFKKPVLKAGQPYFNLSHSGKYVVLAAGDCPVGVDIEHDRSANLSIVERLFLPEDLEEIQTLLDQEREEEAGRLFQKYWTQFEAIIKMKGTGLLRELEEEEHRRLKEKVESFEFEDYTVSLVVDGEFDYEVTKIRDL